jgi:hypothetical protein
VFLCDGQAREMDGSGRLGYSQLAAWGADVRLKICAMPMLRPMLRLVLRRVSHGLSDVLLLSFFLSAPRVLERVCVVSATSASEVAEPGTACSVLACGGIKAATRAIKAPR